MTSPLPAHQATVLATNVRMLWVRRALSWGALVAASVVSGLHANVQIPQCTDIAPCRPETVSSLAAGLLFAAAFAGFVQGRVTAWLAGAFFLADVVSYMVAVSVPADFPIVIFGADAGFVLLCVVLAHVGQARQLPLAAQKWFAAQPHERLPAPPRLPRPGRAWRAAAALCLPIAVGLALWGWFVQSSMDGRQTNAAQVTGEVVGRLDDFAVRVKLPGGQLEKVTVVDAQQHPTGQRMLLYVDSEGLHQPVSEPYDGTGWLALGAIIGGLGLACWARAEERRHGLSQLFDEEQPVSKVFVRRGLGVLGVYPGDARIGEPATAELRFWREPPPVSDQAGVDEDADEDEADQAYVAGLRDGSPRPALLFGIPAPDRWCTVIIDGEVIVPSRPLRRKITAPPFVRPTMDGSPEPFEQNDQAVSRPTFADAARLAEAPPLGVGDLPPRAEDIDALEQIDRDPNPYQVRTHVANPVYGYLTVVSMPVILVMPVGFLPRLPLWLALSIAAVAVGLSVLIVWPMFLRPRVAWNGGGLAVVGVAGNDRLTWREVAGIDVKGDNVNIYAADRGFVVPAWHRFGGLGWKGRTARQLADALRYTRHSALANAGSAVVDPPRVSVPPRPYLLYVAWLVATPAVGWLLQFFSSW